MRSSPRKSILLALFLFVPEATAQERPSLHPAPTAVQRDRSETAHFVVRTTGTGVDAASLADRCETMRAGFRKFWFEQSNEADWVPKCEIVLHPRLGDYQRALGGGAGTSVGCSTIRVDGERIVQRRVDLRADAADWQRAALPHELTHVVLADRFIRHPAPPWADEGMGVIAESVSKQEERIAALRRATRSGDHLGTSALVNLAGYPGQQSVDAFYAQSAGLTRFLLSLDSPPQFVRFIGESFDKGYDRALRDCYGIDGVRDLERRWFQSWNDSTLTARELSGLRNAPPKAESLNVSTANKKR